jgi:UDP-glucose 4-epimerase
MESEVQRHDVVYHLASAVGVKLIIEQPIKTVETIVRTTDVVMEACSKYRTPVVLTSTSETYGKSKGLPFREDDDVVLGATSKRRWAYAAAKLLDEFLALAHHYETSLQVYIARLFNAVGPRRCRAIGWSSLLLHPKRFRINRLPFSGTVHNSGASPLFRT